MKQFVILICLAFSANIFAQLMPVMPKPKIEAPKPKALKSQPAAKPKNVYVEKQVDKATVKFISDVEATLFVDGQNKGELEIDVPLKLKLALGEYSIKVVSKNKPEQFKKWNYSVESTNKEYLETVSFSDFTEVAINKKNTSSEKQNTINVTANTKKTTVKEVIDAYIKAIGGQEAINAVNSIASFSDNIRPSSTSKSIEKIDSKGRLMSSTVSSDGLNIEFKQVINENYGYTITEGKKEFITEEALAERKGQPMFFHQQLSKKISDGKFLGIELINGSEAYAIVDGKKTYYFDVNSGLLISDLEVYGSDGQYTLKMYYKDYREVKGIKFPFIKSLTSGSVTIVYKYTDIKINEGVSDSDFD